MSGVMIAVSFVLTIPLARIDMITFKRLTGALGANAEGIDLSQSLTTEGVITIREGLLEHLVLCFRGQKLLSVEEHMRLARCFGEPEPTPFRPVGTATPRDVLMLDQYDPTGSEAAHFHADNTFRPEPPIGAILQAHVVPERGGDTADEVAAAHEERCV